LTISFSRWRASETIRHDGQTRWRRLAGDRSRPGLAVLASPERSLGRQPKHHAAIVNALTRDPIAP